MITHEFEEYAYSLGIDEVGYTKIPDKYSSNEMYPNTIVAIISMEEDLLGLTPNTSLKAKYKKLYNDLTSIMEDMCKFIEDKGYHTYMIDQLDRNINFSIVAKNANLGEIGNNRLLINDKVGPGNKIMLITTDMPIIENNKKDSNLQFVKDTCKKCFKCVKNCPENALSIKNEKIVYDKKKCIGYSHGCTYCITNCPYQEKID